VITGGILAPILLLLGLKSTPAATISLLLNLEIVATVVIASLVFREAIDKRICGLWPSSASLGSLSP
jgi:drug/metabolite transporter (DMT)-like permease